MLATFRSEISALAQLEPLAEQARAFAVAARAERTREAYRAQWSAFEAFCQADGLTSMPAAPATVAMYLTARAGDGRKVATLAQALAAISQAHLLAGHESPRSSALVRETFKGIRRTLGTAPAQKVPLLGTELQALTAQLPSSLGGARDRALLFVGFAGAFRRSELVALTVADCAFGADGLTVILRHSKTDQEGQGRKIGIPYGSRATSCPVRALQAWLERAGVADGPLFRSVDRHGNVGGERADRDVARIVKRAATAAGLDAKSFAGHSLRAGLATSAAKAGEAAHAIMKQTGHRSVAMVQRNIRDRAVQGQCRDWAPLR